MILEVTFEPKISIEYAYPWVGGRFETLADLTPHGRSLIDARLTDMGDELRQVIENHLRGKYHYNAKDPVYEVEIEYPVLYTAKAQPSTL